MRMRSYLLWFIHRSKSFVIFLLVGCATLLFHRIMETVMLPGVYQSINNGISNINKFPRSEKTVLHSLENQKTVVSHPLNRKVAGQALSQKNFHKHSKSHRNEIPQVVRVLKKNSDSPTNVTRLLPQTKSVLTKDVMTKMVKLSPKKQIPLTQGLSYPLMINLKEGVVNQIKLGQNITATPINPHPFNYTITPQPCSLDFEKRSLLILVKSRARNYKLRRGIRETWGNLTEYHNVKLVFMLGLPFDKNGTQDIVETESKRFGDIIQQDYKDAYYNNTYKTIMGFNWGVKFCSSARFFFFVDDDHLILLPNVFLYIERMHKSLMDKVFQGYLVPHSRPFHEKSSKWYVTIDEYPHDFYPPYLAGGAYLVSFEVALKFTIAFPYVKYLRFDDSYLGIVASKLGVRPASINKHFMNRAHLHINDTRIPAFFASHGFKDPAVLARFWRPLHTTLIRRRSPKSSPAPVKQLVKAANVTYSAQKTG